MQTAMARLAGPLTSGSAQQGFLLTVGVPQSHVQLHTNGWTSTVVDTNPRSYR